MGKIISIDRKQAGDGSVQSSQKQKIKHEPRITLSQKHVWDIFNGLKATTSPGEAFKYLTLELPTRRHLTYWLGQIGHKFDVRRGRGLDFQDLLKEIANRLWTRFQNVTLAPDEKMKGQEMKKKHSETGEDVAASSENELTVNSLSEVSSEEVAQCETPDTETIDAIEPGQPQVPSSQAIGRIQGYWISTMKIFADCAVQTTEQGVFDVLGRNFETSGELSWWLWRIGHADKCKYTKRRDIVDAARKVSAELHRDLSRDVGRRVARW